VTDPGDRRPPVPGRPSPPAPAAPLRTQLRRPTGTPEGAPPPVAPLPPLASVRPVGAAAPMRARPRPVTRGPVAETLGEKLARQLPLWMLYLVIVPILSFVLGGFIPWGLVHLVFLLGSVPGVFLIPLLALWQTGFLIYLWLNDSELLDRGLLAKHLLAIALGTWAWIYAMPSLA
jgi:hypothetical protein